MAKTNDEIQKEIGINYGHFECDADLKWLKEDIDQMLDMARVEGYKEGQKDTVKQIFAKLGLYGKLEGIIHISVKDIRYKMFNRYRRELTKTFKVDWYGNAK